MAYLGNAAERFARELTTAETEPTQLVDLHLYRKNGVPTGMASTNDVDALNSALDDLDFRFPEYAADDLALALFAAYVARLSENSEAVFGLGVCRPGRDAGLFQPLSIGMIPDETFEQFLGKVVRQRVALEMRDASSQVETVYTGGMTLAVTFGEGSSANSDIHLKVARDGSITFHLNTSLDTKAVDLIAERMTALAEGIVAEPLKPVIRQPIMSPRERKLVVQDFNATDKYYGYDGGLVAMLEKQAAANPDHPAAIFKGEALSFTEFNARANRLARILRAKGVGKDTFVGLCLERSHELVIGLWAVLKAGGAYVPLNTEDPEHRVREIIEDCRPKVVLTQARFEGLVANDLAETIVLPEGGEIDPEADGSDLDIAIGGDDLAYMIYTSGSTGKPKGVVVEHAAIHNRVVWMHEEYGLTPEDRVLQKTPYTFDVSVWEFLWSFAAGSTLVIAEPGGHVMISYLYRLIRDENVTFLHFVPSVLRMFMLAPALDQLPIKKVFCSGEALGFDQVQEFYAKSHPRTEVHNLYGPTEAAVDVSYWQCPREPRDQQISIGRPVANTSLYILDELDQPVPVGVPGELHIGGVQLARGYWACEDLTAEKFIPSPLEDAPHKRLYRTGDLSYFAPNGDIMYLGRNDFQVKINGVRMELGEIETAIREQGGIKDVVVVAEEESGNKVLIAYIVAVDPSRESVVWAEQLKAGVGATRPVYYIPKEIRFLDQMPLTTSGKINRKVLAEHHGSRRAKERV